MIDTLDVTLPGLNCGLCGYRTCDEFRQQLPASPELIARCIHLSTNRLSASPARKEAAGTEGEASTRSPLTPGPSPARGEGRTGCTAGTLACPAATGSRSLPLFTRAHGQALWRDSLDREFDFYLEHFPKEPGPREIILPHNPLITREMEVRRGDLLIGRPLGMSCGCPITHCGVAMDVDARTGVIVWCVTGPLGPREKGFKDLGYYIAEGYEGLVRQTRCELKVGMRYFFQPHMCMLQWRHSGLLNYLSRNGDEYQVRVEGLWIG